MTVLLGALSFILLFLFSSDVKAADLQSASYAISGGFVSGGGENKVASSSYNVEEGSIDFASKSSLTSTNFNVTGQIGSSNGARVPVIQSVSPGNLSRFFTDQTPSYTVTAQNPGSGTLNYQLKDGSVVKCAWQASNILSYALSAANKGRHSLTFQVKNEDGTTAMNQDQYLFRRPVK